MENYFSRQMSLFILLVCGLSITSGASTESLTGPRNSAVSIAKQLGYGIKRVVFYLDSLIEKCDGFDDLNDWLQFISSHLKCDAEAYPKQLKELGREAHPVQRLSLLCKHWTLRKKCSNKLATKLNSCLGSLEDGRAGANGFRLADAHMKFLCAHRIEYSHNLDYSNDIDDEWFVPAENLPIKCYRDMESSVNECIIKTELSMPLKSFCQKFQAAKECLLKVSTNSCGVEATRSFLEIMLDQIELDVDC